MQLKEDQVQGLLSEWGVSVEDFVALCETMLKRCDDPRAERILDNLLECVGRMCREGVHVHLWEGYMCISRGLGLGGVWGGGGGRGLGTGGGVGGVG